MRKSHLISLFIVFIAVSVLILVQAFSGESSEPILSAPTRSPVVATPTLTPTTKPTSTPTATPEPSVPRPEVDVSQYANLSTQYEKEGWYGGQFDSMAALKNTSAFWKKAEGDDQALYLTFNLGTLSKETDILDTLKSAGVKATFFVPTNYLELNKDHVDDAKHVLKRIVEEGHTVGILGQHKIVSELSAQEFCDALWEIEELYQTYAGKANRVKYYRARRVSPRDIALAEAMGYEIALYTCSITVDHSDHITLMKNNAYDGTIFYMDASQGVSKDLGAFMTYAKNAGFTFFALEQ